MTRLDRIKACNPIRDVYIDFSKKRAIDAMHQKKGMMTIVPEHLYVLISELQKHRKTLDIECPGGPPQWWED